MQSTESNIIEIFNLNNFKGLVDFLLQKNFVNFHQFSSTLTMHNQGDYMIKFSDISRSVIRSDIFLGNFFHKNTNTYSYFAKVDIKKNLALTTIIRLFI